MRFGVLATDGVEQVWYLLTTHSSTVVSFFHHLGSHLMDVGQALSVPTVNLSRYQMPLIGALDTRKDVSSILSWVLQ